MGDHPQGKSEQARTSPLPACGERMLTPGQTADINQAESLLAEIGALAPSGDAE